MLQRLQVQKRCQCAQARDLYRLLVEDSAPIRHAAAELVAGMLEPQGRQFLAQVCLPTFLILACFQNAACVRDCVRPFLRRPWPSLPIQDMHGSL